jgi:very-short-patch-repair endonuclease
MREGAKLHYARQLRRDMTEAEHWLWARLRHRQLAGFRFRRQHPGGRYIADFACIERRLIVEVDGSQHLDSAADVLRDDWLRQHGFVVVRCWNHDVLERTDQVLARILQALEMGR